MLVSRDVFSRADGVCDWPGTVSRRQQHVFTPLTKMWPYILKPNQDHEDKKKKMCCCFIWHISQTVNLFTSTKRQKHFTVSFTLQSVEVLFQACLNVHLLLFNWRFSCFQRSHVSWCFSCFHQRIGGDEDRLISPENCFRTHSEDCSRRPAATVVTKQHLF